MTRHSQAPRSATAFGRWLRDFRAQLGLSRHALAAKAGVCASTLRNIETGRHRMQDWTGNKLLRTIAHLDPALYRTAPGFREPIRAPLAYPIGQSESEPLSPIRVQLLFATIGAQLQMALELDRATLIQLSSLLADTARGASTATIPASIAVQIVAFEPKAASLHVSAQPAR